MCDGFKFESEQGLSRSFNPLLRFPEVWNPTLSCIRAASGNRLYEGNDVLHPPRFALLFLAAVIGQLPGLSAARKLSRNAIGAPPLWHNRQGIKADHIHRAAAIPSLA
jgi:hypothetical protein